MEHAIANNAGQRGSPWHTHGLGCSCSVGTTPFHTPKMNGDVSMDRSRAISGSAMETHLKSMFCRHRGHNSSTDREPFSLEMGERMARGQRSEIIPVTRKC